MEQRNIIQEISFQIKQGKMTVRLILINVFVFLLINLLIFIGSFFGGNDFILRWVTMPTEISMFLFKPWTLFTSIISHYSLSHLFFNLLFLFFAGSMFEQLFGAKKLLITYILAGVFGGLFEILATFIAPDFSPSHAVIGASGAIMGIFAAVAFYRPQTPVYLFGIVAIPIYVLAIFFFAKDLIGIGEKDQIAHFAHLGGAFLGYLAVQKVNNSSNIINRVSGLFERKNVAPKTNTRYKTDEVYNAEKRSQQERIDNILDKIAKSGYDSLTREEKDFLFKQGQK